MSSASTAAAVMAQAIKASGAIVRVAPRDFLRIVERQEAPLVVFAKGWFFHQNHQYLTSYKGLSFFTKSQVPLDLPSQAELVQAQRIWMPA